MLIGLVIMVTDDLRGAMLSFMGIIRSPGVLVSKLLFLDRALSLSIKMLLMPQLNLSRLKLFSRNWVFDSLLRLFCGAIILVLRVCLLIQFFRHGQSILKLIFISSVNELPRNCYKSGLSLPKISLPIYLKKPLPLPLFQECKRNLRMFFIAEIEGG
jgi:hypothetical protein